MPRFSFVRFLIFLLAALFTCQAAYAFSFPWPNPKDHPRVVLYADQELDSFYKTQADWFNRDFLILGFNITGASYGHTDEAIHIFSNITNEFRYKGLWASAGISGTTAIHDLDLHQYPANAASIEDMSIKVKFLGPWMRDPKQLVVDLKDPLSRYELETGIEALWRHVHGPVRFVDNAAIHPAVARMQAWDLYCVNIGALRNYGEKILHINTIFNVFARPWQLNDLETKQLIGAVAGRGGNGIALPLPWSKSIQGDKLNNSWAIYRYRQLLDAGLVIIMIPSDDAPINQLYSWVETWRKPTDRIYYALPYWQETPF